MRRGKNGPERALGAVKEKRKEITLLQQQTDNQRFPERALHTNEQTVA
jgi:hypothetical protein